MGARRLRSLPKHVIYRLVPMPTSLYLRLYKRDTDARIRRDREWAEGTFADPTVTDVMAYAAHAGLKPEDRLLDFGCGSIRTGKHLIRHLDADRYIGVDISPETIAYARKVIAEDPTLSSKNPQVWQVDPFQALELPWTPDFILCNSVFTHLPEPAALRTFQQLRAVMGEHTRLAFTAFVASRYRQGQYKNFWYPASKVIELAGDAGIEARECDGLMVGDQTAFVGRAV